MKPALTATSEQQPPVNNDRYKSVTASLNLNFIRAPLSSGLFFRLQGWLLYTGLTIYSRCRLIWSFDNVIILLMWSNWRWLLKSQNPTKKVVYMSKKSAYCYHLVNVTSLYKGITLSVFRCNLNYTVGAV